MMTFTLIDEKMYNISCTDPSSTYTCVVNDLFWNSITTAASKRKTNNNKTCMWHGDRTGFRFRRVNHNNNNNRKIEEICSS